MFGVEIHSMLSEQSFVELLDRICYFTAYLNAAALPAASEGLTLMKSEIRDEELTPVSLLMKFFSLSLFK